MSLLWGGLALGLQLGADPPRQDPADPPATAAERRAAQKERLARGNEAKRRARLEKNVRTLRQMQGAWQLVEHSSSRLPDPGRQDLAFLLVTGEFFSVELHMGYFDEVGAGVNRSLLREIGDAIIKLNREQNYTFCMIEHDMEFIARLCDPVICMAEGKVLAQGTLDEIKANDAVIEAYLGTGLKNKAQVGA